MAFYPDDAARLFQFLRSATDEERKTWWTGASPDMRLWLVSRINPIDGFAAVADIWNASFCLCKPGVDGLPSIVSDNFKTATRLVGDFVRGCGRLPQGVGSAFLEQLAGSLLAEDEPYSQCTYTLVLGLEYANRVNRVAGWYPPVAFEIWRAAKKNEPFCTQKHIAEYYLKQPIL